MDPPDCLVWCIINGTGSPEAGNNRPGQEMGPQIRNRLKGHTRMSFGTHTTNALGLVIPTLEGKLADSDEFWQESEELTRDQFQALLKELSLVCGNRPQ